MNNSITKNCGNCCFEYICPEVWKKPDCKIWQPDADAMKANGTESQKMEPIKTSTNVEFDVIYADGTRQHVSEGVLFEVKDNKLIFHNGTDRAATIIGVAEAVAEVVSAMGLSMEEKTLIFYNIHKRIFNRKYEAADKEINTGGQNNGI